MGDYPPPFVSPFIGTGVILPMKIEAEGSGKKFATDLEIFRRMVDTFTK